MAFQQGLSGLNSASKALDATSNNIANSSTVGYKSSSTHFGDVYASSLAGGGANQVGIGVNVAAIHQQFTQGNITSTNNPLDISINGAGFFRMDTNGAPTYSRNGQFHLDKNGYIVNDQGLKLTGYAAKSGIVVPSTPTPIQISASDLAPIATGAPNAGAFSGVKSNLNFDSRSATKDPVTVGAAATAAYYAAQVPPVTALTASPAQVAAAATAASTATANLVAFDPTKPQSYNYSTALSVYDTLGNPHTLTMFLVKTATPGTWNTHFTVDSTAESFVTGSNVTNLVFGPSGSLTSPANGSMDLSIDLNATMGALGSTNGAVSPLAFKVDFTGSTQFGSAFGTNRLEQNGYAAGHLVGLSAGTDGVIQGRYSNGQTFNQGQIVLANFTNPNGLQSLGNNQWVETSVSGPALVGAPNTSSLGTLTASTVEESNVDLTAELVNLITQQRNYQANAQSIKTQDQIMQTLVNLR